MSEDWLFTFGKVMDENKLKVLRSLEYKIQKICGNCKHFKSGGKHQTPTWSTCTNHRYHHKKHTEMKRELSVNIAGTCSQHVWSEDFTDILHGYTEFMED